MARYRFGVFELDAESGELSRDGRKVRLRPQPCAVLLHLIGKPGELVRRADLQRRLWPEGTHVHYEQGLNSCIKQVRAALGDNPRRPRYIETLSRRGYRFMMRLETVGTVPRAPSQARVVVTEFRPR